MEIEDLKQRWQEQDRKLEASLQLNRSLLNEAVLNKVATATTRLFRLVTVELVLNLAVALWLGSFLAEHASEPRFLLPAAVLAVGVIALIVDCVRQMVTLKTVDPAEPVAAMQKKLGRLRVQRTRTMQWILLTAPLVWIPLLIVGLEGLLGLDAYAIFSQRWLAANLLFGAAVIPLAVWTSRRYADRMERSPFVQRLMRDLAGRNVNAAMGFLGRLESFEQESR